MGKGKLIQCCFEEHFGGRVAVWLFLNQAASEVSPYTSRLAFPKPVKGEKGADNDFSSGTEPNTDHRCMEQEGMEHSVHQLSVFRLTPSLSPGIMSRLHLPSCPDKNLPRGVGATWLPASCQCGPGERGCLEAPSSQPQLLLSPAPLPPPAGLWQSISISHRSPFPVRAVPQQIYSGRPLKREKEMPSIQQLLLLLTPSVSPSSS